MIRFVNGSQLTSLKKLKRSMHLHRTAQFFTRLQWNVDVNEWGEEHDEYDAINPLYIILEDFDGEHEGSLRLLPTTGKTMVNDHFLQLTDGVEIRSPYIWECTRFCVAPTAERLVAAKLLAAGAFLMKEFCIDHFVGVFDEKMQRIYRALDASPTILGKQKTHNGNIGVGLWQFDQESYERILTRARVTTQELTWSFEASEPMLDPLPVTSNAAALPAGHRSTTYRMRC
ncbi:acyl-homoserine-lactone synthase [Roseovarius sp. CAU 1744]|uniref:acyl-homoserine-lactone synthase n=1 Tax=Roseovarius sp. CAU 1744 TaxID=3140368 RepID=UPI00325AECC5